ncbi:MAG: beta-lactamase family protein, partial [Thermoanaerobaculia bacterium]|nr:beta-lactamase family protein [Thermoanaerobaculia bacterium]
WIPKLTKLACGVCAHRTLLYMMIIVALLLGLSLPAGASSMPEVDRFIEERMKRHLVPGLAVVAIRNGEVVHRRGFGELDETRPVIIGSLSKAITATAVLQLVDEGRIELDAPMQRYLGETRFSDPAAASVTVRQLLNQNSGIPTEAPRAAGRDATLAEHVEALRDVRFVAAPGERHIYSSPNYQILGRIVELVSGQPFGAYVQGRIFSPLGMTSSGVDAGAVPGLAPGHNLWWGFAGPSPYRFEKGRLPTASIITTADDLSRFALSHLGIGPQLLTPESLALAHRGAAQAEGFSYAMGWRDGTTAGAPSLWHGGSLPSYRGAVVLVPQTRSAVIVLTNSSSLFADHTREIAAGIVALLEKRPLPQGFRPLRTTYAVIAVLCVVVVALQLRSLRRAIRKEGPASKRPAVLLLDFALPLAVVLALPRLTKISYRAMWESAPDIVTTVVVLLLLGLITGFAKLRRASVSQPGH